MKLKKFFQLGFLATLLTMFTACGDDSSSSAGDEESSSSVASFKSSSSLSTRADINYKKTISIGDTMRINLDLFKSDSSKMKDKNETYLDSGATNVPFFLGELPKGSRIKVFANSSDIKNEKIFVKSEFGETLQAIYAAPKDESRTDSVYRASLIPSYGASAEAIFRDSNTFVTFSDNYFYIDVEGKFSNNSTLRLKVLVDTSYYQYTGEDEKISMKMTDTLRGIMLIDEAPDEVSIAFSASEGYSINLVTKGENIVSYKLTDKKKELGSSKTNLDTMLVPNDTVSWYIKIKPESFSSVWTGPYAFFEAKTKARALEQGEYFSFPDSIKYPGEVYMRTRPKDDIGIYKYNLRQEQFVWLGDYKKGDSLIVKHWIDNYNDESFENVSVEILDKNKKVQYTLNSVQGGSFKIKDKWPEGPYYLHYLRLNSYPLAGVKDSLRYVLQLSTMVQQPGLLKTLKFYDAEHDKTYSKKTIAVGDTLRFKDFTFQMNLKSGSKWKNVGEDISWIVPCTSLAYLNNSSNYKESLCDVEQDISSDYLIAQRINKNDDNENVTVQLIAQSDADPSMRDTLDITIIAKGN